MASIHRNVYLDISAHLPEYLDRSVVQFMDTRGRNKVLFGTNAFGLERCKQQLLGMPLKAETKQKELRQKHYRDYAQAHEKGGLRWAGGAWAFDAIPQGLGDDVYPLAGEPYGASVSISPIAAEALAATEKAGYAHDICAYCRNYLGSIIINKYAFGGPFPKPDFIWQTHICC